MESALAHESPRGDERRIIWYDVLETFGRAPMTVSGEHNFSLRESEAKRCVAKHTSVCGCFFTDDEQNALDILLSDDSYDSKMFSSVSMPRSGGFCLFYWKHLKVRSSMLLSSFMPYQTM